MPIITGFDIETTGLLAPEHKIIETNFRLYDLATRRELKNLTYRMNPQRSITPKAFEVHGITVGDLKNCPLFSAVAPNIIKILQITDVIVAHNGDYFDIPFLYQEFEAAGYDIDDVPDAKVFDTMLNARWAVQSGKSPSLEELCYALDIEYDQDKAHAADYDTDVMMQAVWKGIDLGKFVLPI